MTRLPGARVPPPQVVLGDSGEMLLLRVRPRRQPVQRADRLQRRVGEDLASNVHITSSGMLVPLYAAAVTGSLEVLGDEDRHRVAHANAEALFGV